MNIHRHFRLFRMTFSLNSEGSDEQHFCCWKCVWREMKVHDKTTRNLYVSVNISLLVHFHIDKVAIDNNLLYRLLTQLFD